MKRYLLGLLLAACSLVLSAQGFPGGGQGPSITGRISGTVIDSLTGDPVEFATIVLETSRLGEQVDGVITDTDGSFKLQNVKPGTYNLRISFLGYNEKTIRDVETTPEKPDASVDIVRLEPSAVALEAIEVQGEAALIENRIDKMVYNAEKDVTSAGGDASDVLRKVPLLSVDLEGNVSLRGSSNLRILINGRPSTLFASNPAEALKTIPADQIKQVEVITTPSAKYDGEGTGGIINIITKKKEAQGFTGTVNTSVGTRQNNAGANLNWVQGRFGLNGSAYSFWSWKRRGDFSFLREDYSGSTTSILRQDGFNNSQVLGYNGSVGAFYDFNAYNSINSNVRFNGFNNWRDGVITGGRFGASDDLTFERFNDSEGLRNGFDWTTDFRRTFPDSERELTFAFQLSGDDSNSENFIDQTGNTEFYQRDLQNINDGLNLEYTVQLDYVHPFSEAVKMETGAKAVLRRIDSDYATLQRDTDSDPYQAVSLLTDIFNYDQDVYAGYVSFNVNLGEKTGVVAGVRYERTTLGGQYDSEQVDPFEQEYDNWLPTIILNRKLKGFSNIKASFTQRIQRPSLFFINPFTEISDPNNISFGNPSLDPELVTQYELAYNTYIKGIGLNAALFYRETSDLIESYLQVDPQTQSSVTTYLNIGQDQSVGVNLFASATIAEVWTLRGGINLFTYNGTSQVDSIDLSRESLQWSGNLNSTIDLGKDWKIEAFGFFRSPRQTLQGENPSFSIFGIGIQKDFSKRTSLGIRAIEPWSENKAFVTELRGENFYQTSTFAIPFRSIGISFSHRFGQIDFKQRRRQSAIDNDDLKGGDDNQQF